MAILAIHPQGKALQIAVWDDERTETTLLPKSSGNSANIDQQIISWLESLHLTSTDLKFMVTSDAASELTTNLGRHFGLAVYDLRATKTDECWPVSRVTGTPALERRCTGDTFILKYLVRQEVANKALESSANQFIVAHLDEESQIGALCGLDVVDVLTSYDEGPFALRHSGGLPFDRVLDLCMDAQGREEVLHSLHEEGGLIGYLGVQNLDDLWTCQHDQADSIREALVYQISKEIGAFATVFAGHVTAILLAGKLTKHEPFVAALRQRIGFIAPISVYPGNQLYPALQAEAKRILDQESTR